jgi:hypothetical protein
MRIQLLPVSDQLVKKGTPTGLADAPVLLAICKFAQFDRTYCAEWLTLDFSSEWGFIGRDLSGMETLEMEGS